LITPLVISHPVSVPLPGGGWDSRSGGSENLESLLLREAKDRQSQAGFGSHDAQRWLLASYISPKGWLVS
ncbi:hypothetical protein P7K49_011716, partial [Saguinus oedipus]